MSQEFWRPAQPPQTQYNELRAEAYCANCGTQLAPGARFCHVCGNEREPDTRVRFRRGILRVLDFESIRQKIGLSMASTILLLVAGLCVLATLLTGFVYRADTMAEWQAVQMWRIEWMLAALVALVAALLFKKAPDSQ
jgi:hypothetical protein